jgi:MoaA/NifB/PqqE/SkfB family radical SAM enzyme
MNNFWKKIKKFFRGVLKYVNFAAAYRRGRLKYNHLFLNITSYCNSNCVYCEVKCLDHKKDLDFQRLKKLIKEAKDLGVKEISFSGGEPFVYYKVWELIDYTISLGLELNIMSNGLMIADFSEEKMAALKKLKRIFISFDSPVAEIHNQLRGGADFFQKTIAGVKKMLANDIKVSFASVISNQNYSQLEDLIKFTSDLGVKSIFFQPLHVWSNYDAVKNIKGKEDLLPAKKDFSDLRKKIKNSIVLAKNLEIDNNLPAISQWIKNYFIFQQPGARKGKWIENILPDYKCLEIFTKIFIDCDGGVLPCAMLAPRGNLKNKSLKKSLLSLESLKESIRKGNFPKECEQCSCQVASNFTFSLLLSPLKNLKNLAEFICDKF